jgi:hypothetical protein
MEARLGGTVIFQHTRFPQGSWRLVGVDEVMMFRAASPGGCGLKDVHFGCGVNSRYPAPNSNWEKEILCSRATEKKKGTNRHRALR